MAQVEVYRVDPGDVDESSGRAVLREAEAHHLLHVRRARRGEEVMLIDGHGTAWRASLLETDSRSALLALQNRHERWREPAVDVHLGLGTLKGDHFFAAVDLAVQAGVGGITPLDCRRSVARWSDRKTERANRVSLAAAKQCGRGLVPPVLPAQLPGEWGIQQGNRATRLLLSQEGEPMPTVGAGETVAIAIGPEGGFYGEEEAELLRAGFQPVTLGPRRLRSEAAAFAAITLLLGSLAAG